MVGRARDQDHVIWCEAAVLGPRNVEEPRPWAARLVDREVDLVLEDPGEVGRRRPGVHEDGADVAGSVSIIGGYVRRAVDRLRPVEADETVEQVAPGIEGLGRVTRGPALSVRRRGDSCRRGVLRVAGHEAVAPGTPPVGRAVVALPHVAIHDLSAIVVRA